MTLSAIDISPYIPTTLIGLIAILAFYCYSYFKNKNDNRLKEIESTPANNRIDAVQMYLNELGVTIDTGGMSSAEKLILLQNMLKAKSQKQLISAVLVVIIVGCVTFLIWSKYNAPNPVDKIAQLTAKVDTTHPVIKALSDSLKKQDSISIRNQSGSTPANAGHVNIGNTLRTMPVALKAAIKSSDSTKTAVISQLNQQSQNEGAGNGQVIKAYPVQWFKAGYSVQFADIMIHLYQLNKQTGTIVVQICHNTTPWVCDTQIEDKTTITLNQPHSFSFDHKNYQLFLRSIDHGGRDPFTLAAYIDMQILNN